MVDKDQGHSKASQSVQEDDKSATEIAKTCNNQETGEPPGGGDGRLVELGKDLKANEPVPELGEDKAN